MRVMISSRRKRICIVENSMGIKSILNLRPLEEKPSSAQHQIDFSCIYAMMAASQKNNSIILGHHKLADFRTLLAAAFSPCYNYDDAVSVRARSNMQ